MFQHVFVKGKSRYTLLLLHGTGGDENDLVPIGKMVSPEANILSPRGKVLEFGMNRFFVRYNDGTFDEDSVRLAAAELKTFVKESAKTYAFDPAKVVAIGYSNGANTATAMLLDDPATLAGAALLHGMIPLQEARAQLKGKPIFLSAGENDAMIPAQKSKELEIVLEECGARVSAHWGDGGHEVTRAEIDALTAWFAKEFGKK